MQQRLTPLIKGLSSYRMTMSDKLVRRIKELVALYSTKEWSGILFTKVDRENMMIEAVDYINLNVGTASYTKFEFSHEVVSYMIENNLVEDGISMGLCHSHNDMNVFFSGTDMDTFIEETVERESFVSIIVNNKLEFVGLIGLDGSKIYDIELETKLS